MKKQRRTRAITVRGAIEKIHHNFGKIIDLIEPELFCICEY